MTEEQGNTVAEAYTTLRAVSRTMSFHVPAISEMCDISLKKLRAEFPFLETLERLISLGEQEIKGENKHGERQAGGFQKANVEGGKKGGPRPN